MKDQYRVNGVDVFIKDRLDPNVDPNFVFSYIAARVPFYLTRDVEIIYIGHFPEMDEREINAFYEDGAIYVTNDQDDEMDMIEDIIHELSHAVEQKNGDSIYGDSNLEREFRAKRQRLERLLKQNYEVPADFSITLDYDRNIDMFLYKTVGYDNLNQICVNIFPSAYACTSISEYWAKGFEEIFIGDRELIKKTCPILFNKLINVIEEMKE
jgi:hypothetical protein